MAPNTNRVETGIPGFDEMVSGGLKRGSTTLVVGGCGSGKTTLSLQYLYNGATMFDENGVFVSFNEPPEIIREDMSDFGWDLDRLEREGKLRILRMEPSDLMQLIREDYGEVRDIIKDINAKRFVIDSISTFSVIVKDIFDRKMGLIKFCEWLRKNDCTTMMTLECERSLGSYQELYFEEYIVDCVVVMYNIQIKNVRQSALEVLKMRGSKHYKRIVPFTFDKGIQVTPEDKLFWEVRGNEG